MTPRNPTDDPRWDRLIHLVSGDLPAEEAEALRRWVDEDPARGEAVAQLAEIWRATAASPALQGWDAEAELRRIRQAGGAGRVIARVGPTFALSRRSRWATAVRVAVAAALVLVAGGGLLWRLRVPAPSPASPMPVAMSEYRTAPGERLSLRLPDGTKVMLAPGGVLRRPATYGEHGRSVELEGEAYFTVTHDATRPFSVRTARAVAHDLGTRFVVRAYADEPATDVVVAEGSVAVARPLSPDSLVLKSRDRATVTAGGQMVRATGVRLDPYLAWTEGRLVFDRTPLREVVRRLGRWYGIEIRLADPALADRRLTATLESEHAAEAVDLVATALQLSLSRTGSTYVLRAHQP